jgi:hypothetical protein
MREVISSAFYTAGYIAMGGVAVWLIFQFAPA